MRALRARLGNAEGSNTRKQKTESRCVVVKRLSSRAGTRAIRRERLSGRQANWGRGKNVSSARSAPKHSAKSFSPVPLHHEWAGEADEGQPKRHPARERPLPAGQKSRSGGTRPPSPRRGGRGGRRTAEAASRARETSPGGAEKPKRRHPPPFTTNGRRGGRRTAEAAGSRGG